MNGGGGGGGGATSFRGANNIGEVCRIPSIVDDVTVVLPS